MAEPTVYLFDGYNLLHAGRFETVEALQDRLATFLGLVGARGVVVFDGEGKERTIGPLEIRFAENADSVLERLASELRGHERVCVVTSDIALRVTTGQDVAKISSPTFLGELRRAAAGDGPVRRMQVADRLDPEVRARLDRLRRGR